MTGEFLANLPVEESARFLLGWHLLTPECEVRIVETEAYHGPTDPGSHAYRGPTPRNQVMFGESGRLYMYFTYGNHWMANVVCCPVGEAGAVLIRAAEPVSGIELMRSRRPRAKTDLDLLSGPGKLCAALALDSKHYGLNLFDPASPVRLTPHDPAKNILVSTRIGLAEGKGEHTPWRFIDADRLVWASRPHPKNA